MWILMVEPIGAGRTERYEFRSESIARQEFENSCSPFLAIEVWLQQVEGRRVYGGGHWHRSEVTHYLPEKFSNRAGEFIPTLEAK